MNLLFRDTADILKTNSFINPSMIKSPYNNDLPLIGEVVNHKKYGRGTIDAFTREDYIRVHFDDNTFHYFSFEAFEKNLISLDNYQLNIKVIEINKLINERRKRYVS